MIRNDQVNSVRHVHPEFDIVVVGAGHAGCEAALAAALRAAHIEFVPGPDDALTVDVDGGRVTPELLAGVARDHQVLLTELRRSDTNGLEQLFFSLTAANAAAPQEVAS